MSPEERRIAELEGQVAALVDGEPAGWMSGERFAEVKRRAAKEGL